MTFFLLISKRINKIWQHMQTSDSVSVLGRQNQIQHLRCNLFSLFIHSWYSGEIWTLREHVSGISLLLSSACAVCVYRHVDYVSQTAATSSRKSRSQQKMSTWLSYCSKVDQKVTAGFFRACFLMSFLTELFPSVRVSHTRLKGTSKWDIWKGTLCEPEQEWHSQVSPHPAAPPVPTWRALVQAL